MNKFLALFWFCLFGTNLTAQEATIRVEKMSMKTYMFSDPDPVANIGNIYPYSRFDGFTANAIDKEWKMVILENDYIEVFICPDIGGKVWGAIEKSSGKEFLYFNHVVKFRDVAMRGPWTSGGLEFNFGDIGHIPTCATPVDYITKENNDGSVSCIVGALDLPSGTRWNIEIKVSPDKAFFETKVSWFNNTEVPHTYYHWMNAAAKSAGNLEFIYPGANHIGHGGELGSWPIENGRDISWYEKNDFGPYKSYHVINSYSDFFGGYWHDDDFGFGHYASYDDKPGKKLWIWGLSDQGMIWEDLLTDTDGQYIEFQAGKLFNQAAFSSTYSPFKHREFQASDVDIMNEIWFPLKETEGMVAMSEYAVLNVEQANGKARILLSPLQSLNEELIITYKGQTKKHNLDLKPLELFSSDIDLDAGDILSIKLGDNLLSYYNKPEENLVERPVKSEIDFNWESAFGKYYRALELEKQRSYKDAMQGYRDVLKSDPSHLPALGRLAQAHYRRMEYDQALTYAIKCLSIDTYDPSGNYMYGLANSKLGNIPEAKSGFSIASHDPATRSAAYLEMARLFIREKDYAKAKNYANKATDFNRFNISATEILLYTGYHSGSKTDIDKYSGILTDLDPLSDFARFEKYKSGDLSETEFTSVVTNEFPFESFLDLAIKYYNLGDTKSALRVLWLSPDNTLVDLWEAYVSGNYANLDNILSLPEASVFPHRVETAIMLEQLAGRNKAWQLKYYLGLICWNKGLEEKAKTLFKDCGDDPEVSWYWLSKAELFKADTKIYSESVKRAYELDKSDWRAALAYTDILTANKDHELAAKICADLLPDNPENARLGLSYAKALYGAKDYMKCLSFLESFELLPYEGAVDGKKIFTEVCIRIAIEALASEDFKGVVKYSQKAKEWPKNLGVGKPYDVDNRIEDYLIIKTAESPGNRAAFSAISEYSKPGGTRETSRIIFQLHALKLYGQEYAANELISKAIEEDNNNIYLEWAKARFEGNSYAESLEDKILHGDNEIKAYDTKFVDKDFPFVIDILNSLGL